MDNYLLVQSIAATCSGLAARQHGAVATYQLRASFTASEIRHELHDLDRWHSASPNVFVASSSKVTDLTRVSVGCLSAGPGTTASHRTAAALWGVGSFRLTPVDVVRTRDGNGSRLRHLFVPHDSTRFTKNDLTSVQGIAVATPSRTMFDLAQTLEPEPLKRAVDNAWSMGLVDHWSLTAALDRLAERGRPGIAKMRGLLAKRGPEWRPPESNLESRLIWLMERAGMTGLRGQVDIGGRTWLGRVDFLHESGVVIEVQSRRFHSSISSREDDQIRLDAMRQAGYSVIEVWDTEIWHDSDGVVRRIQQAIRARQLTS